MCQPVFHQAALAKDVKAELDAALGILAGKGKGKGAKKPRGLERKKMWEDVRALRKEWVCLATIPISLIGTYLRYRQREGGVVRAVLSESQVLTRPRFQTRRIATERSHRLSWPPVILPAEDSYGTIHLMWSSSMKQRKLLKQYVPV